MLEPVHKDIQIIEANVHSKQPAEIVSLLHYKESVPVYATYLRHRDDWHASLRSAGVLPGGGVPAAPAAATPPPPQQQQQQQQPQQQPQPQQLQVCALLRDMEARAQEGPLYGVHEISASRHAIDLATDPRVKLWSHSQHLRCGQLHAAAVRELILAQRDAPPAVRNLRRRLTEEVPAMQEVRPCRHGQS